MNPRYLLRTGFTLIELMIVVAIIALLAVVAIPKFGNLVVRARESQVKSKLSTIRSAMSIYYADTQSYPGDLVTGLTTASKYLDNIPDLLIPAVSGTSNPGHGSTSGVTTIDDDMATGAWTYLAVASADEGSVHVNCSHADTVGTIWSSY